MPLQAGTKLGPYEILAPLGAGGMGEVYKATDSRLNRTVAIKVLPPAWAGNPEMKQRFEREAQTIAGLNHPNICTLHDIGHQDGTDFLVMECVEGETLTQRLTRGPLPMGEALKVAIAIADALDKAHRQGVVHRDLKPSNVMLSESGAKLLDFGLAKLQPTGQSDPRSLMAAAGPATTPGAIMGTIEYMAPEQLEGKEADARTDIFAFGALLHEMTTGKRAFEGKSRAVMIAAIATVDPEPPSKLQPAAPAAFDHVVKRCLAKDPECRWQSAHALLIQLQWIAQGGSASGMPVVASAELLKRERRVQALLAVTAVLLIVLAVPTFLYLRGAAEPDAFTLRSPVVGLSSTDIAISPNGSAAVFVARPDPQGGSSLFVRPVGSVTSLRLAGTDDATQPFWSPDSRFVAFVAGGKLKKVAASGGAPQQICDVQDFSGGAWSSAGTIVYGSAKGIQRVSAEGGKSAAITTLDSSETGHFWPNFLPDGRHYLYLAWSGQASSRAIYAGTLDSKERTRLMSAESNPLYAAPGYLLFHREATLFAQPFDAKKLTLAGEPIHVADDVSSSSASGRGNFDVSQSSADGSSGVLIYFQGANAPAGRGQVAPGTGAQFGWVDRTGKLLELAGETGSYGEIDLSPDGKLIALTRQDPGSPSADIWTIDWQRGAVSSRLTLDPADDLNPIWSPDGSQIAFTSYRKGNADIYVKNANGVGEEKPLLESSSNESVKDWSKDGKYILYEFGQDAFEDIYALPIAGDKKPFPVVQGHFHKNEPQLSFDGKWLAYTSDESGKFQVYVISFPAGDQKLQISTDGGGQPRWRRDGKELYYRALDLRAMAVEIKPGAKIESGIPHLLFTQTFGTAATRNAVSNPARHMWVAATDGQRFLVRVSTGLGGRGRGARAGGTPSAPSSFFPATQTAGGGFRGGGRGNTSNGLTIVLHWTSSLGKK